MIIKEINTPLRGLDLYNLFKDFKYSCFLHSSIDKQKLGQYSFIGFNPFLVFKAKGDLIQVIENEQTREFRGDPLAVLRDLLSQYAYQDRCEIPFLGGAVGYFSYDLCHHIEKLPRTAIDDVDIPDCFQGFYDGIIIEDHRANKVFVAALGIKKPVDNIVSEIEEIIRSGEQTKLVIPAKHTRNIDFKSNLTKDDYVAAINKIKQYIRSGDIYQVNMTQRFECTLEESPFDLYVRLDRSNPAPFASFVDFGEGYIVSSSPERFIKITNGRIETRPIKGTRPRGTTPEEDLHNKEELLSSEKDRAELLMIVDLERNDLGRICKTGSVKVTELFHLEEYATVFHSVSTVIGELKTSNLVDCLKATFPGGSITGAPKIRAMEIIDELEPTQRNIYTGSIGYLGFNGDVDLNIVIRTIVCKGDKAYFQVGGGIVWDSDAEAEYEECFDKAKALMIALNGN